MYTCTAHVNWDLECVFVCAIVYVISVTFRWHAENAFTWVGSGVGTSHTEWAVNSPSFTKGNMPVNCCISPINNVVIELLG